MHLCVDRLQETLHVGPSHSLELLHPALGQDQAPQSLAELLVLQVRGHRDWIILKQVVRQLLDFDGKVGGDGTVGEGAVGGPSEAGAQQ
jgi:hypothetical protein